jgi:glyoxylase-like metal-dependent hydrolase (beta-lactamase superfamily II)
VRVHRLLWDGDVVALGATQWQVYHMPGHADGHVVVFDPAERVAITGDVIQGCSEAKGWLGLFTDVQAQRRSLDRLGQLGASLVLMGHHNPLSGRQIDQELALAKGRVEQVLQLVTDGLRSGVCGIDDLARMTYRGVFGRELTMVPSYVVTTVRAMLVELSFQGKASLVRQPDQWRWGGQ